MESMFLYFCNSLLILSCNHNYLYCSESTLKYDHHVMLSLLYKPWQMNVLKYWHTMESTFNTSLVNYLKF